MFRLTGIRIYHRLRFRKELKKGMDIILAISEILNHMYLRRKHRARLLYQRSKNVKLEGRREKQMMLLHPARIIGYQVDNLPNAGSSFRIVSFCSLLLFLLLLGLGFIYRSVDEKKRRKKETNSGKNLLSELLLATSSLSLLVTPEKSFRLRALT